MLSSDGPFVLALGDSPSTHLSRGWRNGAPILTKSHKLVLAVSLLKAFGGPGVLRSDLPAAFYNFPRKQQVLALLVETIDWYRLCQLNSRSLPSRRTCCFSKTIVRLVCRSSVFRLTSPGPEWRSKPEHRFRLTQKVNAIAHRRK